ncbi:unnamed protein product [Allacma fusca]|uniref:Uncharacterized protein n=1 Tax=Allacma fusca TaxID=39272 RepID=A0A8J2KBT4_9HEXA|nr:unnamed protein product [Allacma fusca]
MKKEHKKCLSDDYVELFPGSGLKLDRSELAAMQTMSSSMTIFARNLFRKFFDPEDVLGHSLLGRKSTSLPNHVPLPSVDSNKRDAVIGKLQIDFLFL